jgi:hypothetical protein
MSHTDFKNGAIMKPLIYVLLLICLPVTFTETLAAVAEVPVMKNEEKSVVSLELEWALNHRPIYFSKALQLFSAQNAEPHPSKDFYSSQLNFASSILMKSRDGSEYGDEASPIRCCQAKIVQQLANVIFDNVKDLPGWPELRAGTARLLMCQRGTWLSLRDPNLDGKTIELDSAINYQPDQAAQERNLRNKKIEMQLDLKRFLGEFGPAIDRYMVNAFSIEPKNSQMLSDLLVIGNYSSVEREKLTNMVESVKNR